MPRNNFLSIIIFTLLLLSLFTNSALAHDPPVNGRQECGIISNNVFYSNYYSPPSGTPVTTGSCSWVKQSNTSCGTANYGGTNYTLYPYVWVCNMPLDDYAVVGLVLVAGFGYYQLRKSGFLLKQQPSIT